MPLKKQSGNILKAHRIHDLQCKIISLLYVTIMFYAIGAHQLPYTLMEKDDVTNYRIRAFLIQMNTVVRSLKSNIIRKQFASVVHDIAKLL